MSWHIYFFSHVIPLPDNKQRGKFKKAEWEALLVFLTKIIPTIWANSPILELNVLGEGSISSFTCPRDLVVQRVSIHITVEGYYAGQAWFPHSRSPLTTPNHPLALMCVETLSRRIFFITFPRTTVRLMVLYHPGPPLLPSLKIRGISALFQSSGTSPNYYDHSTTFKVHSSKKSGCHWTALRNHWRICMDSKSNRFVFLSYSRI